MITPSARRVVQDHRWRGYAVLLAFLASICCPFDSSAAAADAIVIKSPVDGALVAGSVQVDAVATVTTTAVEFSWSPDGAAWDVFAVDSDAADGWRATWDSRPYSGPAELRARTDEGSSAIVSVTADNTPPSMSLRAKRVSFSPNGDGRKETTAIAIAVSEPTFVDVVVRNADGDAVRTLATDVKVATSLRLSWDGRSETGARLRDGCYRLIAKGHDKAGNAARASVTFRIDTTRPRIRWTSAGGIVGARRFLVPYRVRDASPPLRAHFRLSSAYGHVAKKWRRVRLASGPGAVRIRRRTVLASVPGVYRIRSVLTDGAGNRSRPSVSHAYRLDHAMSARVVARVDNVHHRVAITFDDCGVASSWDSILRTLARADVKAAFFCPGKVVQAYPRLAARTMRAGHTIGAHGWDHAFLSGLSFSGILWRLKDDRNVWWQWRAAATPYVRPPGGMFDATTLGAAGAVGYRYVTLWDVDPSDWSQPGAGVIVSRVLQAARPGSIILLHVQPETASALPAIIDGLRRRGLRPTGLDQLIRRPGAELSRAWW